MKLESFLVGHVGHHLGQTNIEIRSAVTGDLVAQGQAAAWICAKRSLTRSERRRQEPPPFDFSSARRPAEEACSVSDRTKGSPLQAVFSDGRDPDRQLIDIDGGIGTLFVYAVEGPPGTSELGLYAGWDVEPLERRHFVGQHLVTPLHGAAVHINAFNFPCWGLLEKLAPALLAGVPLSQSPRRSRLMSRTLSLV